MSALFSNSMAAPAGWWACRGCGTTYSTDDPDLIVDHVEHCDDVDGVGDPVQWQVVDNVTGNPASRPFTVEENAAHLCRGLNLEYGPGGRFGLRKVTGDV